MDNSATNPPGPGITYRTHGPGDLSFLVYQWSLVFCKGLGYNQKFEALLSRIAADFLEHFDAARERCWIAERGAQFLGCVMLVKDPEREGVAKLRFLLVDAQARGQGVGSTLVRLCVEFAREAGYQSVELMTEKVLEGARRIYNKAGFECVETETHSDYGQAREVEVWRMRLDRT